MTYNDLPGGLRQVEPAAAARIDHDAIARVYVITSRGTYTASKNYDALAPAAERSVATYAQWVPTPFDLNGAFTSLNQVEINGNSFTVSGVDRSIASATCPGPQATIPGLATPDGDISLIDFPNNINGNPDNAAANIGTSGVAGTAKDEVKIDWAGILAGTAFPADYVWPTWPTATQFNNWPVTRVNGDLTLPSDGKGILIVTGDLTWNGSPLKTWEGLILIGGVLTANGQGNIYGALVTGLNVKIGTRCGRDRRRKRYQRLPIRLLRHRPSAGSHRIHPAGAERLDRYLGKLLSEAQNSFRRQSTIGGHRVSR